MGVGAVEVGDLLRMKWRQGYPLVSDQKTPWLLPASPRISLRMLLSEWGAWSYVEQGEGWLLLLSLAEVLQAVTVKPNLKKWEQC